jgi:glyoxylase-like metal-dependent hydrolase (beta-lactamase superfamily II)
MPSRRSILKGVLSGIIAAPFVAPSTAFAKAPYAAVQAPGFYRLKIGSVEVTALSDGTVALPLAKLYTNTSQQYAQNVLKDAFLPELVPTSVNAFLVNNGDRLVLIDAGTGAYLGPSLGKLVANIEASGYKVDDIDDVILTHIHTDHSGGFHRPLQ